jgi:hypothetical protein
MGQQINRNTELIEATHGRSDYPLDIVRKLQGGTYNTFVVPFALSKYPNAMNHINGIVDVNNENTQLLAGNTSILRYTGSTIVENGVGEYVLQLNFEEWDGTQDKQDYVAASTPILIKPENNITTRMHLKWNPFISTAYLPIQDDVTFTPVLAPTEVQGGAGTNNFILVADNRLARLSSTGTMLGLRAYFINSTGRPIRARVVYGENEATSIPTVVAPEDDVRKVLKDGQIIIIRGEKQYNIQGQVIE